MGIHLYKVFDTVGCEETRRLFQSILVQTLCPSCTFFGIAAMWLFEVLEILQLPEQKALLSNEASKVFEKYRYQKLVSGKTSS